MFLLTLSTSMSMCIADLSSWKMSNCLQLNVVKIQFLSSYVHQEICKLQDSDIELHGSTIKFSKLATCLRVLLILNGCLYRTSKNCFDHPSAAHHLMYTYNKNNSAKALVHVACMLFASNKLQIQFYSVQSRTGLQKLH